MFPISNFLRCTEIGCEAIFQSIRWSEACYNLTRHLKNVHQLPWPDVVRWCVSCKIEIPKKISSHNCFKQGGFFSIPQNIIDSQGFQYHCFMCGISFPRKTSYISHSNLNKKVIHKSKNNTSSLKSFLRQQRTVPANLMGSSINSPEKLPDTMNDLPANQQTNSTLNEITPTETNSQPIFSSDLVATDDDANLV